jgi:hypothetical protein
MSTSHFAALVAACALLGACGSSTTPEPSPQPTQATEASTPVQASEPVSTIEALAEGILVVEPGSGDLLRYSSGRWEVVYDGLSYDAEVEGDAAYVESAFSAQGATFAALCCEPFSGIFGKVLAGEVQYSGYGTRPALLGERIVAFVDVYDEQISTKLTLSPLASPQDVLFESVLSGVVAHSTRLQPLGKDHVAFTWSRSFEGAPWYLAVVNLSEPVSYDESALLERSVKLQGVRDLALVVDGSGRIAVLSQGDAPSLEFYEHGDGLAPVRSGSVESVPAGTSTVLIDGKVRAYLLDGGVSVSDGSKELVLPGSFTWMGR